MIFFAGTSARVFVAFSLLVSIVKPEGMISSIKYPSMKTNQ